MSQKGVRAIVVTVLQSSGWSVHDDGFAIATRTFDTAAAPKEAVAYLRKASPGNEFYLLQGVYRSEGRNVMERESVYLPLTGENATITNLAKAFVANAEEVINQSYARRIWLMRN